MVPSQSGGPRHRVVIDGLYPSCDCADFELTGQPCKHLRAARIWAKQEEERERTRTPRPVPMASYIPATPKRPTYKQDWPNYNKAQNQEKHHVRELLKDLCAGLPGPVSQRGTKGGQTPIAVSDAVFSIVYKVYTGLSARRFKCDLDDAQAAGYLTKRLCHNSVLKAMESESLTPILKDLIGQTALPLAAVETTFAVDSSGFCTNKFRRWFDHKWGGERSEHVWVKIHLACGVVTNIVTAADILDMNAGDAPQFPALIDATAEGFTVERVCADMAYPSNKNYETVERHGAVLYAPFKTSSTGAVGGLYRKAFHYFQLHREEFLAKYHARSNVESTFSGIKRKMGDSVRSKSDTAMKNEVYCKVIAWNLTCLVHAIYEMGVVPLFWQDHDGDEPRDILKFPTIA
jgi:Transposase DDE domain/SWIM zinc finger